MKKYKYNRLIIEPYMNGYRVFYKHDNGNKELLTFKTDHKAAVQAGKIEVDNMNDTRAAK